MADEKLEKEEKAEKKEKKDTAKKASGKKGRGAVEGQLFELATENTPKAIRVSRLQVEYKQKVVPSIQKQLSLTNPMEVPRLKKIVVNCSLKDSVANPKLLDALVAELAIITGQKPVLARAQKAIAAFKLRKGLPIGASVILRRKRMYEFFDRLVNISLPRVRDFRGVSPKSFDGRGNYCLGIKEQIIFPEINYDKVDKIHGMNITFVTSAKDNKSARLLLTEMGMPFRK